MRPIPTGVLVLPGWERGFCPLHVLTFLQCGPDCLPARRYMVQLVEDYQAYWERVFGRKVSA
jgi:hypothetical protein